MKQKKDLLEIANSNFKFWEDALHAKDLSKVINLYSENNTFLPTLHSDFKCGQKEVENYFQYFLLKNPLSKVVQQKVQIISNNAYLHSGLYDFELFTGCIKKEIVRARFTYLWQKELDGFWKIFHHHSSIRPNTY